MTILDLLESLRPGYNSARLNASPRKSYKETYMEGQLETDPYRTLPNEFMRPRAVPKKMRLALPNKNKYTIKNDFGSPVDNYSPLRIPALNNEGTPLMRREGNEMVPQYRNDPLAVPMPRGGKPRNQSILNKLNIF